MPRYPLLVQFEYHTASSEADSIAHFIHSALNNDPTVPGLRIPTCFIADYGTHTPPIPHVADEADRVLVMLLADDHLAVNWRRAIGASMTWSDYMVRLRELCESSSSHRFMPIQLSEHGKLIDPRLDDLNFLQAWTKEEPQHKRRFILRRLISLLIRQLHPHEKGEDSPPLTIFLSHAKADLGTEPRVVSALLAYLTATQPEKTWCDTGDIISGSQFAREIERGIKDSALLAVVTDSYSSRAWCRREVLLAKQHQRPVVVIDAIQEREVRSFPYIGNVPVIRWKGDAQEVVDLLLQETLRHAYAEEILKQRKRPDDSLFPIGPELVTLIHCKKELPILYPDPPLGAEELMLLDATGIRIETPLQRFIQRSQLSSYSLIMALSISEPEDIAHFGLRCAHLDAFLLELSRYLLISGIRLAYGGHLGPQSYTIRLADLLDDPILESLRGQLPMKRPLEPQLINFLAWPMSVTIHDEARLGSSVEIRCCQRPADVDDSSDPVLILKPTADIPVDTPARRYAWARGLSEMRIRQVSETNARIILGGRIGSQQIPYKGRMPGVLEEVLLMIRNKRPLYLIGAFGGCANLAINALEGLPCPELTWNHQSRILFSEELRQLYLKRGQQWDEYEEIVAYLNKSGMGCLNNGLDIDENRELARTRSQERMIELILLGLQRHFPRSDRMMQ